jgi:alkanesulfonate monooxygenase SsuD/methylene tetrahydromethanopterin reductase-like flavin-dependent oxidoreductase (luciferase family)
MMPWTGDGGPLPWPASTATFDASQAHRLYDDYLTCMAAAEGYGFDWVTCNEHHFSPYGMMPNPNLIGAALINRTTTAKIAVCGNLIPLLNPVRVAEEYAMLDVMSGGRLIAGFMRGVPHEYRAYNVDPNESWGRHREAVSLIIKAWTEDEPFAWHGEFYDFDAISIWPKPMQKPHPRVILSGTNAESAAFAAEHHAMMGMAFNSDLSATRRNIDIYREEAQRHGWTPTAADILIGQSAVIAETDDEARSMMLEALGFFNRMLTGPLRDAQLEVIDQTSYFTDPALAKAFWNRIMAQRVPSIDDLIAAGSIFCGSPKSVVEQIRRVHAELGNGVFSLMLKVGNLPDEAVYRSMRLFKSDVLPHVAHLN